MYKKKYKNDWEFNVFLSLKNEKKNRRVHTVTKSASHAYDPTPTWKWRYAAPKRRQHSPLTHNTNIQKQG